jgi:hypothetical protein
MFSCLFFCFSQAAKKSRQHKRRARFAEKISTRGIQTYEICSEYPGCVKKQNRKAMLNCKSYGYKQSIESGEGSIQKFSAQIFFSFAEISADEFANFVATGAMHQAKPIGFPALIRGAGTNFGM